MKNRTSHEILDLHTNIGWDIDGTLVDGPQSAFWRKWIKDNHEGRKMWLVTFRTYNWVEKSFGELESYGLKKEWFQGIKGVPPLVWGRYSWFESLVPGFNPHGPSAEHLNALDQHGLYPDEWEAAQQELRHWKALTCKELGCTVLIDDMDFMVKDGCTVHGVTFVHAIHD